MGVQPLLFVPASKCLFFSVNLRHPDLLQFWLYSSPYMAAWQNRVPSSYTFPPLVIGYWEIYIYWSWLIVQSYMRPPKNRWCLEPTWWISWLLVVNSPWISGNIGSRKQNIGHPYNPYIGLGKPWFFWLRGHPSNPLIFASLVLAPGWLHHAIHQSASSSLCSGTPEGFLMETLPLITLFNR